MIHIQSRTTHDVEGEPFLPCLLRAVVSNITISAQPPCSLMGVYDLREDSDAPDIRIILAPIANTDIDGLEFRHHRLISKQLTRAMVGESVSIQAQCSLCAKYDTSVVVVAFGSHVWEGCDVEAAKKWSDCGVVFNHKPSLVIWHDVGAAVTEPDEIPVVTVRGMRFGACFRACHKLTTLREELELVFEGDVPIGVIFDYQG